MVQINKAQAATLALLTRAVPRDESTWEVEETNMESVIVMREFPVEGESGWEDRDVLIAADGQAVALSEDGTAPTVLLTSDGPPTP